MKNPEIYLKPPNDFIIQSWKKLLPDWQIMPQSMIIILLNSSMALDDEGELIESEKARLFTEFLELAQSFKLRISQANFVSEIISPKDGMPRTTKGCKVLEHPLWQTRVYPGILLSQATVKVLESLFSFPLETPPLLD
ncbi:MAG: hypothetical protein RLZZ148_2936 [Cyanobacteriota bacterium]